MRRWLRSETPVPDAAERPSLISPLGRLVLGVVMVMVAWTFLLAADIDLQVRYLRADGVPMRFVTLEPLRRLDLHAQLHTEDAEEEDEVEVGTYPGVILVHGFAGSSRLMLSYAQVLARAGYGVLLLDLPGHGASTRALTDGALSRSLDRAYRTLAEQPEIDSSRVALVGHSMGAGVVMDAALRDPQRYLATVAVSPVTAPVTPLSPRNLQLQAGGWERSYLDNARILLEQAGGPSDDFINGRARELVTVAAADHLSILFRTASHEAVLGWLEQALGRPELPASGYRDRRILWWLVHVAGFLIFTTSMAPVRWQPTVEPRPGRWLPPATLIVAPFAATLTLWVVSQVREVGVLAGVAVGPALALWLLCAGLLLLLVPFRIQAPRTRHVIWGVGTFGVLWLAIGATSDLVWLDWGLESRRLWLWPVLGMACVPWFVGVEAVRLGARGPLRFGWWVLESLVVCLGLLAAGIWVEGLGLVASILPLLPLYLGALSVVSGRVNDPWAAGIGGGLFFGWLLAAVFPLLA